MLSAKGGLDANQEPVPPDLYYAFALAERLGMTVAELKTKVTHRELKLWQAYDTARARILKAK